MAVEYDANHYLVTFGGYMVAGHEQWQCGLRFGNTTGVVSPTPAQLKAALEHISIQDIYSAVSLMFGSASFPLRYDKWTTLEYAKLAAIGKDGKYLYDPIEYRSLTKGFGDATYTTPPQLALVVSLWSGTRIGHANHGRYYLPCPSDFIFGIDPATGQVLTTYIDQFRAAQKTMLEKIGGEVSTVAVDMDLCIFSPKTSKSVHVTEPSHKKVEKIGIGYTIDTQRSRRRSLPDGVAVWSTVAT